jgi:hypothetical protein
MNIYRFMCINLQSFVHRLCHDMVGKTDGP